MGLLTCINVGFLIIPIAGTVVGVDGHFILTLLQTSQFLAEFEWCAVVRDGVLFVTIHGCSGPTFNTLFVLTALLWVEVRVDNKI